MKPAATILLSSLVCFAGGWVAATRFSDSAERSAPVSTGPSSASAVRKKTSSTKEVSPDPGPPAAGATYGELMENFRGGSDLSAQGRMASYAAGLKLNEVKKALEQFKGMGFGADPRMSALQGMLYQRWAEIDNAGLLAASRSTGDMMARFLGGSAAVRQMARQDPVAAWKEAESFGSRSWGMTESVISEIQGTNPRQALDLIKLSKSRESIWNVSGLMASWAATDPQGASAAVAELPPGELRGRALSSIASGWAARDFNAAFAWAGSLANPGERSNALGETLQSLAQNDPGRATAFLDGTELGASRSAVLTQITTTLALKNFDQAVEFALGRGSFQDKSNALSSLGRALTPENRDRFIALAESLPANLAKVVYQSAVSDLVYSNPTEMRALIDRIPQASIRESVTQRAVDRLDWTAPEEALALFNTLQPSSQKADDAGNIANYLATYAPEKALAWADTLTNPALKKSVLSRTLAAWAENDPAAATARLATITDNELRLEITRSIAGGMVGRSLTEAEKWASGLSGSQRSAAMAAVVEAASHQDPARSESLYQAFAAGLSPEDAARSENHEVARTIAARTAETDPAKAGIFAASLPEGGAREQALAGVAKTWAGYDPGATSAWIDTLPAGRGRDLAAQNLVTTVAHDDPDSAWAWTASISEPDLRRSTAATVLQAWKENGRKADALKALESAGFTPEEKRELTRKLD